MAPPITHGGPNHMLAEQAGRVYTSDGRLFTGFHSFVFANGDHFEGNFHLGCREGKGKNRSADGCMYEG
jgi:hypothetical protein